MDTRNYGLHGGQKPLIAMSLLTALVIERLSYKSREISIGANNVKSS